MQYARLLAAAGSMVVALQACRDVTSTTPERPRKIHGDLMLAVDPLSSRWNRFEADVNVSMDGPAGKPMSDIKVSRGFSYRVTRRKDAQGRWVTDMNLGQYRPRMSPALADAPAPISQIIGMGRTGQPQFVDATGRTRTLKALPPIPMPASPPRMRPRTIGQRELPAPPSTATRQAFLASDTASEWIDDYVLTPRSSARLRARLQKGADRVERGQGQSRFVRERNGRKAEILVDDATGQVRETRTTEKGKLRALEVREYQELRPGVVVLKSERMTRYHECNDIAPLVITMVYKNIRMVEDR